MSQALVLVTKAKGVLGLVEDAAAGSAVDFLIFAATKLVSDRLGGGLVLVGLETTSHLVGGVGEGLSDLVASRLGGIGLNALLGLVGEIFAECVRHVDWCLGWLFLFGMEIDCSSC